MPSINFRSGPYRGFRLSVSHFVPAKDDTPRFWITVETPAGLHGHLFVRQGQHGFDAFLPVLSDTGPSVLEAALVRALDVMQSRINDAGWIVCGSDLQNRENWMRIFDEVKLAAESYAHEFGQEAEPMFQVVGRFSVPRPAPAPTTR